MKALVRKYRKLGLTLAVAATLLTSGLSAQAAAVTTITPDAQSTPNQVVSSGEISESSAHVWTRDEMLNAIPYPDTEIKGTPNTTGTESLSTGPLTVQQGGAPSVAASQIEAAKDIVAPFKSETSAPNAVNAFEITSPYTSYPYSTVGKVFFRKDGVGYVCSGSSAAGRAVWTAGHCVFNNATGRWHTNWVFVPAYKDGSAPLGQWAAQELWTLNAYMGGNQAFDIGMAVVYRNGYGYKLSQWVGWLGYMANYSRYQTFTALGYPQEYPFNGQRMFGCYSGVNRFDYSLNPASTGINCNMTRGSSGGPWVVGFGGGNYVNSVTSYGYSSLPGVLFGPYFGDGAINLYNTVTPR